MHRKVKIIMLSKKRISGITLIELVITIAIVGILLATGLPNLKSLMQSNAMTSLHNNLLSSLSLARNTAINKGAFVALCESNSLSSGCVSTNSWDNGWIVFMDKNNNGSVDSGETIISIDTDKSSEISMSFTRNRVTYGPQGYASGSNGTFTFCDARGDNYKKGMIISNNGHIRVAETAASELASCSN